MEWAVENTATADGEWAAHQVSMFGDRALPIAGPGAPLVSEFALMEYAATLGMSTDAGKAYVGKTLELRYRLPRLWEHVMTGRLAVWRAMRVAEHTCCLPMAAAAEVDQALAPAAGTCSWAQVDRLVEEALARHDPDQAEERRQRAADGRRFDVETDLVDTAGTVQVEGCLDLADALDLEAAVSRTATQLAELGSTESLDVRRSMAVGEIARQQLALDLATGEIQPGQGRGVVLNVHLTEAAIAGVGGNVARCGNTRTPVLLDQVRDWCQAAGQITVVPIKDLAAHHHVEAYEIPDRIKHPDRAAQPHLRLPPLHPPRRGLRPRPHRPPPTRRHWRSDLLPQHRPPVPPTPPRQDPRTVAIPADPSHRLRVDHPPRLPASSATTTAPTRRPARRHRPRPTPHPANPDHPAPSPGVPPPRRGHRHARPPTATSRGADRSRARGLVTNRTPRARISAVWSQTDDRRPP